MKDELVRLKGMGNGVRINIDAQAEAYEVIRELEAKIRENKAFFGDGNCNINFNGRKFTPGEKQRFSDTMKRLLPLCRVEFEQDKRKSEPPNDWIVEYKERHGVGAQEHPAEPVIDHTEKKKPEKEFYSIFRSNRARLYQGFVHDGMTIRSDGHLILLGTACAGAELIAVGNILVIGGLYGSAHAGCNGHNGSYILAMDMQPEALRIAGVMEEYTYENEEPEAEPQKEDVKRGILGRLRKPREAEETIEKTGKSEFSAVALLKNNKIELDNFTITTFTNPKNMI